MHWFICCFKYIDKIIKQPGKVSGGSDSKESSCNAEDLGSISGSERFPGEGNGYPLQYSCLESSMDRGTWSATIHGVTKNRTLKSPLDNKEVKPVNPRGIQQWIFIESVRGSTLTKTAHYGAWPGTIVTICMSCFMTGDPAKELGTNKPPPTGRVQERSRGDTICPTTSQNPSLWHPSWLNKACTTRKYSESEWLAKDNPETNPITIKLRLQAMWQSSSPGFPYPPALHPGALPNKNLLLCQHMHLLRQFISECWTRAPFQALECVPIPETQGLISWSSNILATWCKEPSHWRRPK